MKKYELKIHLLNLALFLVDPVGSFNNLKNFYGETVREKLKNFSRFLRRYGKDELCSSV